MFLEPPAYGVRSQQPELRRDPTYQRVVFEIEKMLFTKIPLQKGKYLGKPLGVRTGEAVPRENLLLQKGRKEEGRRERVRELERTRRMAEGMCDPENLY